LSSSTSALRGFQDDANNPKLTSSVGDLLQLTRSYKGRQFMAADNFQFPNNSTRAGSKKLNKSSHNLPVRSSRQIADGLMTVAHNTQEHPVTRAEIMLLENELKDRIRAVMYQDEVQMHALESGNLYQPHKDKVVLLKNKLLNELKADEKKYADEPWLDKMVKCECLNEICDQVASRLVDMLAVSSSEMGGVLRTLRSTYKQSAEEMRSSWKELHLKYSEIESELAVNTEQLLALKLRLSDNEKVNILTVELHISVCLHPYSALLW